jgi:hypothetical protein
MANQQRTCQQQQRQQNHSPPDRPQLSLCSQQLLLQLQEPFFVIYHSTMYAAWAWLTPGHCYCT